MVKCGVGNLVRFKIRSIKHSIVYHAMEKCMCSGNLRMRASWSELYCITLEILFLSQLRRILCVILQAEKFLKCDWLRPVAFEPNLKYLHVKITASIHGN